MTPEAFDASAAKSSAHAVARPLPSMEDIFREVRACRGLLDSHLESHRDELRAMNLRLEAIMDLLKEVLAR